MRAQDAPEPFVLVQYVAARLLIQKVLPHRYVGVQLFGKLGCLLHHADELHVPLSGCPCAVHLLVVSSV